MNLRKRLSQTFCRHEFLLADLQATGVVIPEKPVSRDYKEWNKYLNELWYGPWRNRVVRWSCRKCGKTFEAFCGLDIAPRHGKIVVSTEEGQ